VAAPARLQRRARYLLARVDDRVFLVQRAATASLMPLMWELPAAGAEPVSAGSLTLRHSITHTNYRVTVVRGQVADGVEGRWFRCSHLRQLPLTGLTRKVLRAAGIHL